MGGSGLVSSPQTLPLPALPPARGTHLVGWGHRLLASELRGDGPPAEMGCWGCMIFALRLFSPGFPYPLFHSHKIAFKLKSLFSGLR